MGTDNFFHRRKAKNTQRLNRREPKREAYKKVLIVCEGEKTEPYYFKDLIRHHKINTANVAVDGSCDSAPSKVLDRAVELYRNSENKGDPFDFVYCVFDKDSHSCYERTLNKIRSHSLKEKLRSAHSVPCFEYWLLLHFTDSTKPYNKTEKHSSAQLVLKDLQEVMPNYEKCKNNVYTGLIDNVNHAIEASKRSLSTAQKNHTDNPSTYIHDLVHLLRTIKDH